MINDGLTTATVVAPLGSHATLIVETKVLRTPSSLAVGGGRRARSTDSVEGFP